MMLGQTLGAHRKKDSQHERKFFGQKGDGRGKACQSTGQPVAAQQAIGCDDGETNDESRKQ